MNDHEAIDKIDLALQEFYVGIIDSAAVLNKIAYAIGANSIEHRITKEANK